MHRLGLQSRGLRTCCVVAPQAARGDIRREERLLSELRGRRHHEDKGPEHEREAQSDAAGKIGA